ncbi:N-acetyltransferase [Hymenobacter sp. UV11]|uniref:GNAT family N-acetyltransferase n=1 Tax=Hymenobacter sp. UV11 TaxID=1849735 RepID=UPI00105D2324|nr:GNAT family N-acetyltransferase [Hymenobacter sp. UV11]TDN40136.1 GNAT family acetyltransferase [Hymenobacter sp. UV11]TFZ64818.1 N-acetyltransferase [Hymenobacter sp. UV11]
MNNEQVISAIQPISAAQTYALRHAVLWPDKPPAYVQLPDDAAGQHFGAFVAGELRAVISLFVTPAGEARFRKFATDPAWQGRGLGTALLRHTMQAARAQGAVMIWCDARQNTLPFYQRFGLAPEGDVFYKGDIPYLRLRCSL